MHETNLHTNKALVICLYVEMISCLDQPYLTAVLDDNYRVVWIWIVYTLFVHIMLTGL